MVVDVVFPPVDAGRAMDVEELVAEARAALSTDALRVADPRVIQLLEEFSRVLLSPTLTRRHPELGSLGFFLRRAELRRTAERLKASTDGLVAPRGVVIHFPPANVDTIFVYSWAISALAGNANIVRLSARAGATSQAIIKALAETARHADPAIQRSQAFITYGHDDDVTRSLCAACDLRVIWGGDGSVDAIRRFPLQPHARDMTFPSRSSIAVISTSAYEQASDDERERLAEAFANDLFWFDQAACSSPRTLVWIGDTGRSEAARGTFLPRVAATARRRGWEIDAAMAVQQRVSTYTFVADGDADRLAFVDDMIVDMRLTGSRLPRTWLGAGVLAHLDLPNLEALAAYIGRRDQTVAHYGFDRPRLMAFAETLGSRGVDRIVPIGRALSFDVVWDGVDLAREFTRMVTVHDR